MDKIQKDDQELKQEADREHFENPDERTKEEEKMNPEMITETIEKVYITAWETLEKKSEKSPDGYLKVKEGDKWENVGSYWKKQTAEGKKFVSMLIDNPRILSIIKTTKQRPITQTDLF